MRVSPLPLRSERGPTRSREAVSPRPPSHDGISLCKGRGHHQPAQQPPRVTALPSPRVQPRSRVCENASWSHQADPHAGSNSSKAARSAESNVTFGLIYLTPFTCAKKSLNAIYFHSWAFPRILHTVYGPSFLLIHFTHTDTHTRKLWLGTPLTGTSGQGSQRCSHQPGSDMSLQ